MSEGSLLYREGRWQALALPEPEGPRCYSTGRFVRGRVRHGERVVARWVRDAAALGLDRIDEPEAARALLALGLAAFGSEGEGIVRIEARRGPLWIGSTRALGDEAPRWRAGEADTVHPGPDGRALGAKRADLAFVHRARDERAGRGLDEVLLFDAAGRLVEGARTNLVVALDDGSLVTPPLERGGVAGVARAILVETHPDLQEADVSRAELAAARELIAINSVRGALPITEVDGRTLGEGERTPWSLALAAFLDAAP